MELQSSQRFLKVVLTGGPCSGKSSALALLRDRLTSRGFQVLTVPENATHFLANSEGFQPEWAGTDSQVKMQRIFLDFQLAQEEAFRAFAELHPTKPAVLILDCCTLNSKVYLSDAQWHKVLTLPGHAALGEEELFARYDLVIHLVTCALDGHYEWGPGSSNPGRYHTPEQARSQDARCLEVFRGHPQLRVVPHCSDFNDKIEKVVEFVNDALQIEGLTDRRRREVCSVNASASLSELLEKETTSASLVSTTFLDKSAKHSLRRRAKLPIKVWLTAFQLRSAGKTKEEIVETCLSQATNFLYERRDHVNYPSRQNRYLTRHVIHEEDYFLTLDSTDSEAHSATKLVLRFLTGAQFFELFFFVSSQELILDFGVEATIPAWLDLLSRDAEEAPTKRKRVLRAHSTNEAALGAYEMLREPEQST